MSEGRARGDDGRGNGAATCCGGRGRGADKFAALEAAGVTTVSSPADLGEAIAKALG